MERIPLMIAFEGKLSTRGLEELREWWKLNHKWYIPYLKKLQTNQKGLDE